MSDPKAFYLMVKSASIFDDDEFRQISANQATIYGTIGGYDCGLSIIGPVKKRYRGRFGEHNTIAWVRFGDRPVSVYHPEEHYVEYGDKTYLVAKPCFWKQPPDEHHQLLLQMLIPDYLISEQ